ncbi:replication terminator protein [Bacillus mycoides]|uniref:replication terminator protein n=1 Tax=Bacillus mycoides TaxID=1405 RepID=UPI0025A204EF|nr:replication terminator protein [Bacillus mycoides]MDM5430282.1 replication terminator protein [Bacillus mycoides]
MLDLNNLADGALAEKVDLEFERVLKNMKDPNTDPTKARSITITISFKGNKKRELWESTTKVTSKLVPAKEVETTFIIGRAENGEVIGRELSSGVPGQMYIDKEGDLATDVGEKVAEEREPTENTVPVERSVVDFRKQQTN